MSRPYERSFFLPFGVQTSSEKLVPRFADTDKDKVINAVAASFASSIEMITGAAVDDRVDMTITDVRCCFCSTCCCAMVLE